MSESHATPPTNRPHLRLTPATSVEEFDALADLFLGPSAARDLPAADERSPLAGLDIESLPEPSPQPQPQSQPQPQPQPQAPRTPAPRPTSIGIEAMLLGHLPVLASAWVRQHAAARAASLGGPVALVRLQAGTLTVDLVGHDLPELAESPDPQEANLPGDPQSAVAAAYRHAASMLVRVDETAEPQLLESPAVTGVTVLSGADEAAVVGSYRVIKTACEAAAERPITVAWMGSVGDRVEQAQDRLNKAVEHFLTVELHHEPATGRIDATPARTIYRGPCDVPIASLLRAATAPRPEVVVMPRPRDGQQRATPSATRPPAAPAQPADRQATTSAAQPGTQPVTQPGAQPIAPVDRHGQPDFLLPGLTPIPARCPDAQLVQLALDGRGHLHLLAIAEAGDVSPAEAVEHLLTAAAWARKHRELLALAMPRLTGSEPPQLHLLTDRPKHVRGLLDAEIRLHAITRINVAGRTHTATIELN